MQSRLSLEGSTQQSALSIQPKPNHRNGRNGRKDSLNLDFKNFLVTHPSLHSMNPNACGSPSFASFAVKSRFWLSATL
jgi:hypothetical protein